MRALREQVESLQSGFAGAKAEIEAAKKHKDKVRVPVKEEKLSQYLSKPIVRDENPGVLGAAHQMPCATCQ
jgi:hypothetical protein